MWALTLLACSGAPTDPVDSGDSGAPADTADDGSFVDVPPPSWGAAEVGDRIDAALAAGLPDPFLPRDVYAGLIEAYGDPNCPGSTGLNFSGGFNGCTTTSGWVFGGYAEYAEASDGTRSFRFTADAFAEDPSRRRFDAAGEVSVAEQGDEFDALVVGTWGGEGGEGWLEGGPSVALWLAGEGGTTRVEGGYTPDDALYFDGVVVADGCATGALRLRDPNGSWYTLPLADDCSGCGALTWGDDALGEVCADLAAAVADLRARMGA